MKKIDLVSIIIVVILIGGFIIIGNFLDKDSKVFDEANNNFYQDDEAFNKEGNGSYEESGLSIEEDYKKKACTTKAVPDPEYENILFTLPDCASKKRIRLPAEIEDFIIDGELKLFGYGMHAGAHPEGLDHVWTTIKSDAFVKSMADGKVISISDAPANEQGYVINIDHRDGFSVWYMGLIDLLVKKGDEVKQGQLLGKGFSHFPGSAGLELTVFDDARTDGIYFFSEGYTVSPYDYLEEDQKKELVETYKEYVLNPLKKGETENKKPEEPYLTNPIFLHEKGKIEGAWYLYSEKWNSGKPYDLFTFIKADNEFFKGNKFMAIDDSMEESGDWGIEGNYEVDYKENRFILTANRVKEKYYGIFEIDDSEERAKLKMQYQKDDYPQEFTNPKIYIQRTNKPRREDAENLGVRDSIEFRR